MSTPDLAGMTLAFEPDRHWLPGDYDAACLITALKAQPSLGDFRDGKGNAQSAVRLDNGDGGLWVRVPAGTTQAEIDAAAADYKPPAPPAPRAPSVEQRVIAALLTIPELSDMSKQKLRDALEPPAKEA